MLAAGVDTFVLGCTHYPFALPLIRCLVGPDATVIDPAPAVARQVGRVLTGADLLAQRSQSGQVTLFTSADPQRLAVVAENLLGEPLPVRAVIWQEDGALALT
jgi:glutamate racemase